MVFSVFIKMEQLYPWFSPFFFLFFFLVLAHKEFIWSGIFLNLPISFELEQCIVLYILTLLQTAERKAVCMIMCL